MGYEDGKYTLTGLLKNCVFAMSPHLLYIFQSRLGDKHSKTLIKLARELASKTLNMLNLEDFTVYC